MPRIYVRRAKRNPAGVGAWEVMNGTRSVSSHILKVSAKKKAKQLQRKKKQRQKKSAR